jgi:general secretion pathway protein D
MIALIPHIIRTPDYSAENLKGIYAGSDQVVKLYYAPKKAEEAPAAPPNSPAANPPAPPATAPQVPPVVPQAAAPVLPAAPLSPAGQARVFFAPTSVEAAQGGPVQVMVQVENAADLFSASPIRIKYDASLLRLNDALPGELFTRDGVKITSVKDIRNEVGEATLTVTRAPGTKGISGTGSVLMLNFTAIGKGSGTVTLPDFNLKNSQLQPVAAVPAELPVKIN